VFKVEIKAVKKRYPKNALIVSVMAPCDRGRWHELVSRVCDTGCDGIELNLGCPHGMSERGMGSAIGQVPEYVRLVTEFAKERSTVPVLVKLTPNITDMRHTARSAKEGQADGLSLINTVNSLMGVDVESLTPKFSVGGKISHGGYSGPAIKPIALHHLSQISTDPQMNNIPLSGIGGISSWSDAVEFMLLGASSVQLCTVVMHHGFPIISDLLAGLNGWMRRKKFNKLSDFIGLSSHHVVGWNSLNLHHKTLATIDSNKCIGCGVCVSSCQDGAHQAIGLNTSGGNRIPHIIDENCVGCNLCALACPVDGCITMINVPTGHSELTWEDYAHNELTGYKEVYKRN
jgi:dihydropyrimidine dehydrogenase (NAD+) subunit PreA